MQFLNWISGIFAPEADETVAIAQVRAFSRQCPILFATLTLDVAAVSYSHWNVAPVWLTLLFPIVCLLVWLPRAVHWLRVSSLHLTGPIARRRLKGMTVVTLLMGMSFAAWGIALTRYGDVGTRMHVVFFLGMAMILWLSTVSQIKSASMIVGICSVPVVIYGVSMPEPVFVVAVLSNAVILYAVIYVQRTGYRDFRKLVSVLDENRRLANTDALTALPNRRSFFESLQEHIDRALAEDTYFAVGMIDLDGFKPVNDSFGHHAGDEVLREVANRLENIMEGVGTASRLGGDEFGLIIHGRRDLEQLGRAICASLQMPYALRDATAQIGASVGFAKYPDAATAGEILVERADYALYFAKASHRGTAICFAPEHEARLRNHAVIEQALRSADFESEFHLVFQPIVDVVEARVFAYEALARWTCPTLGVVSPADFILVAERSGLISDLTRALLGKALAAMVEWPDGVKLSFNLSAHDIASAEGLLRIADLVVESGIDPNRIIFEVTETGLMRDLVDARVSLQQLKELGVRIALDDFGTGYSSLSYVHQLPIDKLKIDRSFVTHICEDKASLNVTRSLIDLSRNLGFACVVEGVETVEQFLMLRSAGCRFMQGYLFRKPMAQSEIGAYHHEPLSFDSKLDRAQAPARIGPKPAERIGAAA